VFVHQWLGATKALEFVTGYLLEKLSALISIRFILLFAYFKVPPERRKDRLILGNIGALIMRGILSQPAWRWSSAFTGSSMLSASF